MSEEKTLIHVHCHCCDWDGYTDDLDDACYSCGEYESLKPVDESEDF